MRIWKYPLLITDSQTLQIPEGARLLKVDMQNGEACLWAEVRETAPKQNRRIAVYGTGKPMPDNPGTYIGTFQMTSNVFPFVWHVYDITPSETAVAEPESPLKSEREKVLETALLHLADYVLMQKDNGDYFHDGDVYLARYAKEINDALDTR